MAISMAKTIKEERLRWVLPIVRGEMRLVDVAKVCPHSKRSLERWVAVYCSAPLFVKLNLSWNYEVINSS
jgi:hypothetical protein